MSRVLAVLGVLFWSGAALAQGMTALARVDPAGSSLRDTEGGVDLVLGLSQPVPYRVFTLDAPRRLVLDFSVVDWAGLDAAAFDRSDIVTSVGMGDVKTKPQP